MNSLQKQIKEAEKLHLKKIEFYYSDKLKFKINENKLIELTDLLEKTTNLDHKKDKSQAEKIEKDFNDKINSNDSQEEFF